ncbi:MAG: 4-hydroxy-3-methylbut-2-enyl diphosphate reductase [Lentimicrobium sp.]
MKVIIDPDSGFCFGVIKAVETAEQTLKGGEQLYGLGEMVHNEAELERLENLGLKTISIDQFSELKGATVLLRAHGEPPSTYRKALENSIRLIDATCPIVKRLQEEIKKVWQKEKDQGVQLIIFGKASHAEAIGLNGQIDNKGIIIENLDDLRLVDPQRPAHLFSQTTMDAVKFEKIALKLQEMYSETGQNLIIHKSFCRQVSNRTKSIQEFAASVDVLFFAAGRNSSNGKVLFQTAKNINERTFFISGIQDIDFQKVGIDWGKIETIGISGATSTPPWLMHEIAQFIENTFGLT